MPIDSSASTCFHDLNKCGTWRPFWGWFSPISDSGSCHCNSHTFLGQTFSKSNLMNTNFYRKQNTLTHTYIDLKANCKPHQKASELNKNIYWSTIKRREEKCESHKRIKVLKVRIEISKKVLKTVLKILSKTMKSSKLLFLFARIEKYLR